MNESNAPNDMNGCVLMEPLEETPNGAKEVMEVLHEMSTILKTDLDLETLAICFRLIENGVNAEALAKVILTLRKECANALQTNNKQLNNN